LSPAFFVHINEDQSLEPSKDNYRAAWNAQPKAGRCIERGSDADMKSSNDRFGPEPDKLFPAEGIKSLCFIKNVVTRPNVIAGDYSYYDDPDDLGGFERNILYHYEFLGDKLIIGKFCAIAPRVKFVMNGAYHRMQAFTTYPFGIFGNGWEIGIPSQDELQLKGDTVIGNDVWIGLEATIMPGVHIGDGAIIAAKTVVTRDVPAYTVVGGNPAKVIRQRFDDEVINLLLAIRWWDWNAEEITRHLPVLAGNDLEKLQELA
jgi:virginiamycin A acetyltransferase